MIYCFKEYQLDTKTYSLMADGKAVSVEPLAFDLLAYLLRNRNRVVPRTELFEILWKGKIVTDSALAARIKYARKAVDDDGSRQAVIRTIHGRGFQFVAKVTNDDTGDMPEKKMTIDNMGPVRYCRSSDGTRIAYSYVGTGPPMVLTASWMTHLEEDWSNEAWAPYISALSEHYCLIRYDQRGNGMSQWHDTEFSFERMVNDLEAVIDANDLQEVILFGPSQAASVSIAYAHRFPKRVTHLVLYGSYARGRNHRGNPKEIDEGKALVTLIRQQWGNDNPMIRQAYTTLMMPDASPEYMAWFNEFQKTCGLGENMAAIRELFDDVDVSALLPEIQTPTLVIHSTRETVAPIIEGKLIAAEIPNARIVTLNSANHILFPHEPDFDRMIRSIIDFLSA